MNRKPVYFAGGMSLIGIGIVLLLRALKILTGTGATDLLFGLLFVAGGAMFAAVFVANRQSNWWAITPGVGLAAIGILIWSAPYIGPWGVALVFGATALAFLLVYVNNRRFWWAIMPAGFFLTLTALDGLTRVVPGLHNAGAFVGIFFLGIGLTFLAVYFVPATAGRTKWAVWPAGVMFVMGVIASLATTSTLNGVWAVVLIAGGLGLLYRALSAPKKTSE